MNSPSNDKSVSTLLNRRLFPFLGIVIAVAGFLPNTVTYFTLRRMIPPEMQDAARHATFYGGYFPMICVGLAILALWYVAETVNRRVTRPIERLSEWADRRYTTDSDATLTGGFHISEIRRLAFLFGRLFDEQSSCMKELRTLVGTIRHNLRNHLTAMSCEAQFIIAGTHDAVAGAKMILDETLTVTHILDINAAIAKNYGNVRSAPVEDVGLADLVHECLDTFETIADAKGVSLDAEIPPESLVAVAHHQRLQSILHNLVENAVKYTPAGGSVTIGLKTDDKGLTIEVADTGIGISDADKPRVFEREFRADVVKSSPGSGYGLAYVDSTAKFYRGKAEVRDNTPKGTIFTVTLPITVSSSSLIPHPSSLS